MATWDPSYEASPAGSAAPSTIDERIREDRVEVRSRADREHTWLNTTTAGGYHRAGSAKIYFTTAAPTNRPDAVALDSTDKGRLWYKSSTGSGIMVHNGTLFVSTGVTLSTAQTLNAIKRYYSTSARSLVTTATPTQVGLATKLSGLVPASLTFIPLRGGWSSLTSTASVVIVGTIIPIRAFRSTSGSLYLQTMRNLYTETKSTGKITDRTADSFNYKISTGSALFPAGVAANVIQGFTLVW